MNTPNEYLPEPPTDLDRLLHEVRGYALPAGGAWHLNGVPWHAAPVPPADHDCWVQTFGTTRSRLLIERCACGGIREAGDPWSERNSRHQVPAPLVALDQSLRDAPVDEQREAATLARARETLLRETPPQRHWALGLVWPVTGFAVFAAVRYLFNQPTWVAVMVVLAFYAGAGVGLRTWYRRSVRRTLRANAVAARRYLEGGS